jgi:hypothetical protein
LPIRVDGVGVCGAAWAWPSEDHEMPFEDHQISVFDFEDLVLLSVLQTGGRGRYRPAPAPDDVLLTGIFRHQTNVQNGTTRSSKERRRSSA